MLKVNKGKQPEFLLEFKRKTHRKHGVITIKIILKIRLKKIS